MCLGLSGTDRGRWRVAGYFRNTFVKARAREMFAFMHEKIEALNPLNEGPADRKGQLPGRTHVCVDIVAPASLRIYTMNGSTSIFFILSGYRRNLESFNSVRSGR